MSGAKRWSGATILLHWLSAALIFALLALGWFMVHANLAAATKFDLYQWHKSLGFVSLALLLARLSARAHTRSPPTLASISPWERYAAALTHRTLYALTFASAVSGWVLVSAAIIAIPTRFFGWFVIPNLGGPDPAIFAIANSAHFALAILFASLIALHIAAALKHRFWDRDTVMASMIPGKRT